jgi:hypothetical protein
MPWCSIDPRILCQRTPTHGSTCPPSLASAKPPCAVDRAPGEKRVGHCRAIVSHPPLVVFVLCASTETPSSDCGTTGPSAQLPHRLQTLCQYALTCDAIWPFEGLFRVHPLFRHCCCPPSFHSSRCAGVGSSGSSTRVQSTHLQLCSQASRIPFYLPLAQGEGVQCVSRFLFAHTICTAVP